MIGGSCRGCVRYGGTVITGTEMRKGCVRYVGGVADQSGGPQYWAMKCLHCGKPLPARKPGKAGRPRRYCSPAHKAAYRKRLWALGRKAHAAGFAT